MHEIDETHDRPLEDQIAEFFDSELAGIGYLNKGTSRSKFPRLTS
jgi:hypothetical protein